MATLAPIPTKAELEKVAQQAAGSVKVKLYIDPQKDAEVVATAARQAFCELKLPECAGSDAYLASLIKTVGPGRALTSGDSCSIVASLTFSKKDLARFERQSGDADSFVSPSRKTLPEALKHTMLHEGFHCRQHHSSEAISRMGKGDPILMGEERIRHEQAAEFGAVLFILREAYSSDDFRKIAAVRSKLLVTGKDYLAIGDPAERRYYTGIADTIQQLLEIPPERVRNLTDVQIQKAVDQKSLGAVPIF